MKLGLVLLLAVSCASPPYVRAPVYAPPPSLPAAQARELAAEVSVGTDVMGADLLNLAAKSCDLLREMDASIPGECP